mmetsp:Transcript_26862/g.43192  ORF Transcript_26862/g.43192 Transcript_26862/m.43192 type:complete len:207 (-) Transcript_26862:796-1416(-)
MKIPEDIATISVQKASQMDSSFKTLTPIENCIAMIMAEIIALTSAMMIVTCTALRPDRTTAAAARTKRVYTFEDMPDNCAVGGWRRAPPPPILGEPTTREEKITSLKSMAAVFERHKPPTNAAPENPMQKSTLPAEPRYGSTASDTSFTDRKGSSVSPCFCHRDPATNAVAEVTTMTVKIVPRTTSMCSDPRCFASKRSRATVDCW